MILAISAKLLEGCAMVNVVCANKKISSTASCADSVVIAKLL